MKLILILFSLISFSSFSYKIERSSACERNVNDIFTRFDFGNFRNPSLNVSSAKKHRQALWGDRLAQYRVGSPGVKHDRLRLYEGKKRDDGTQPKVALYFDGNKLTGIETSGGRNNYSITLKDCEIGLVSTFNEEGKLHSNTNGSSCFDINDIYDRASQNPKYIQCDEKDISERNACLRRLGFNRDTSSIRGHQEDLCSRLTFEPKKDDPRYKRPRKIRGRGI